MCPRERHRDHAIALAFGRRVRTLRQAASLSQEALAERVDLHPTFISNVERGYRVPTLPTIYKLASGLGVKLSELVDDLGVAGSETRSHVT